MAQDTTQITIDLLTRIRNLERTLRGLDQIKKRLDSIGSAGRGGGQPATDRAAVSAQKLAHQQQRLVIQTQELTNRQERARQTAERLAQANQRLAQAQQRLASGNTAAQRSALNLDQTLGRVGGSLRNLGLGMVSLGASISVALTAPLTALGVLSARNAVTLDSLQRGLVAITGSADEAGRQMARLTEIAKLPGIGFQEAIQGSIRLQAVGFSAEVAERALRQFSNAVALTGGGRDELARITVQLGQLSAKGKVLAQDLKPIIEAGPAVGRALLQAFGTVNSEDIQALGLSSSEFIDKLITQLEQLPRAAAGLRNTFDNFSDAVFRASSAIGGAILPVLTRLIEVAEPIITRLAGGFAKLPAPVQTLAVAFGALAAAAGPALFVMGQFATGIGGLISAFGRLHALGLIPTIEGFKLLTQVMRGSASLAAGQAATTAAAAGGWIALGGAILGVIALAGGIALLLSYQKDAVKVSKEQIAATDAEIEALRSQLKFVESLADAVQRTASQQERLTEIYANLNTQAKVRLTTITDEQQRLAALREELERQLQVRREERVQQSANLAASLAGTVQQIQAGRDERDSIAARIQANVALAQAIKESGKLTVEYSRQLARQGINASQVEEAIGGLNAENESLIKSQGDLITSAKELNGTAKEQGDALRVLQQQTGLSTRELLSAAKAMGVFKGDIESTLPLIDAYIRGIDAATRATDAFQKTLDQQTQDLLKSGEATEALIKADKALVNAAAVQAKEVSNSFAGALKTMEAFIAAQPRLADAVENERRRAGKSLGEFLNDILRTETGRSGTSLRNAQEQLAKAILEVAEAAAQQRIAAERRANEELLQANEDSYRRQLQSYREYVEARGILTDAILKTDSDAAAAEVETARANEVRLRQAAAQPGIPAAERTRRLAQAEAANEKAIQAETKLAEIESRRKQLAAETKQLLAEAAIQQQKDVRQLDVDFAQLDGRIEDALNTATIEKFREELEELAKSQKFLSEQLARAKQKGDKDRQAEIEAALKLNQSQIDLIELIKQSEFATNKLAAAQEFVRRAKETQAELERQIAFEVEFRGLKEEDAIAKRLEGERKLADSLRVVRDLVQAEIDLLRAKGVEPPQALIEFIRDTKAAIAGLGELPFTEQFRLAEKEFNRVNDERLRKIRDVERAVRNVDIAQVEGAIIIKRINGEYIGDLERQLALLKQIAAASGQQELQQRAADIGETVKDAKDEVADLGTQIDSAGKDALRSGFTDFFNDILNRTATAKEALLNFLSSVTQRINDVIAENLSKQLFESLFGGADTAGEGLIARIGRFFGVDSGARGGTGADIATGVAGSAADTASATALATGATAAATALTTAGAAAGTALTAGGTAGGTALATSGATAGATLLSTLTAAAASFSAAVIAAGAAFAAAVAAAAGAQAASGLGSAIGGAGAATGGIFSDVPGGAIHILEGGYPEAVITTDPKHAARQVNILRELIARTRGFYGRIQMPDFAIGGIVSRETAEANLLSSINRAPAFSPRLSDAALETAAAQTLMNLRITNQVNSQALVEPYLSSEAGVRHIKNIISENSNDIARRIPVRR